MPRSSAGLQELVDALAEEGRISDQEYLALCNANAEVWREVDAERKSAEAARRKIADDSMRATALHYALEDPLSLAVAPNAANVHGHRFLAELFRARVLAVDARGVRGRWGHDVCRALLDAFAGHGDVDALRAFVLEVFLAQRVLAGDCDLADVFLRHIRHALDDDAADLFAEDVDFCSLCVDAWPGAILFFDLDSQARHRQAALDRAEAEGIEALLRSPAFRAVVGAPSEAPSCAGASGSVGQASAEGEEGVVDIC